MSPAPSRKILLDTCTLIDLAGEPQRVAEAAMAHLSDVSTRLFVSAASAWEVAIKTERNRLPNGAALIDAWDANLQAMRAETLPISHADALAAGSLDWEHRDPFDRMLVVQALGHGMRIATRDRTILASGRAPALDTRTQG